MDDGSAAQPGKVPRRVAVLTSASFTRHAQHEAGALPYGLQHLAATGLDLVHADRSHGGRGDRIAGLVESYVHRDLRDVLRQVPGLRSTDVALSLFEAEALVYAALHRRFPRALPPHVVLACWSAQMALQHSATEVHALRKMAENAAAIVVLSQNQVPLLTQRLRVPADRFHHVSFGVDCDYFTPSGAPDADNPYLAAVGGDVGRDWATLLTAAALVPEVRFKVVTAPANLGSLAVPDNVDVLGAMDRERYRQLLRGSRGAVVAVHPLPYPSGQSVLLDSYACGRPAVTAATAALHEYVVEGACLTYAPNDAQDLADQCRLLFHEVGRDPVASSTARTRATTLFTQQQMWSAVAEVLDKVLKT